MAKAVKLSTREFPTQKSALEHFQQILHQYNDGDRIDDDDHFADLAALLERYDAILKSADEPMKGKGQILHFERRRNVGTGWSTPSFWVIREDGGETDFSYIDAVNGRTKGRSQDFVNACREAVAPDLIRAKKKAFAQHGNHDKCMACEVTGEMLTIGDAHLDHAWPSFKQIVSEFRESRGWSSEIPDGVITEPADKQVTATFVDGAVREAFIKHHNDNAILRVTSADANQKNKSPIKCPKIKFPIKIDI